MHFAFARNQWFCDLAAASTADRRRQVAFSSRRNANRSDISGGGIVVSNPSGIIDVAERFARCRHHCPIVLPTATARVQLQRRGIRRGSRPDQASEKVLLFRQRERAQFRLNRQSLSTRDANRNSWSGRSRKMADNSALCLPSHSLPLRDCNASALSR